MANIPVSVAIDNLLKSTPSTTVTTAAALTALGAVTTSSAATGLNMSTAKILGRTTASTGAVEEITVGSGLSLASGNLTATGTGALTDGSIFVGNSSNVATARAMSGDIAINNIGVTSIAPAVIVDADINAGAAIALSKLATGALPAAITVASANIVDANVTAAKLAASAVDLNTSTVTGTLPVAKGGTGTASPAIVAGTNVTVSGTWPNQTVNATGGGGAPTNAQVNTAIEAAPATTLRSAKVIGFDRLNDDVPKELWRPYIKYIRKVSETTAPNVRSFRTVTLGDSVAVSIGQFMDKSAGHGGQYLNAANGVGTFTFNTDFAGNMGGTSIRTSAVGSYVQFEPSSTHQAVGIVYKAKNSGGTFKIQYLENKTGSTYTDCTNTWSISPKQDVVQTHTNHATIAVRDHHQLNVGDTVTGIGIPNGTTIAAIPNPTTPILKTGTSTSGSLVITLDSVTGLAVGMRCATGFANPRYIKEINVSASTITVTGEPFTTVSTNQPLEFTGVSVTLSASATATAVNRLIFRHTDCGSDSGGGVLNTNNGGTEVLAVAWIILPNIASAVGPNYYNIRATNVSGTVDIVGAFFDNGAFGFSHTNTQSPTGHIGSSFAVGGTSLAAQHRFTTEETWKRIFGFLDPDIITYKTANSLTLANLQAYWPEYAAKLRVAAPNALLIVIGSHASNSFPTRDDADMVACDNYWRDYCAATDGALFIDMRANMPNYNFNTWTTDGLWEDGIHAYDGINATSVVVWEAVRPAVEAALRMQVGTTRNPTRVFQGDANEVRLTGSSVLSAGARENMFSVVSEYSQDGHVMLRNNRSGLLSTTFNSFSGIGIKGIDATSQANGTGGGLFFTAFGTRVSQWSFAKGSYHGYGIPIDGSKANRGHRWLCPAPVQGDFGFVIEQQVVSSGMSAATMSAKRILSLDVQATDALEGVPVYAWHNDHTEYLGAQGTGAAATAVLSGATVGSVTVTNKGHSYLNTAPTITFTGGGGSGATATALIGAANTVDAGKITGITVTNAGINYTTAPTVVITPAALPLTSRSASIKFTTESPENTFNYNIHTPIAATEGSGDFKRVIGVIPSYANATAGIAAVGLGEAYYDEATKKVKVRLN